MKKLLTKILPLMLIAALVLSSLTACGKDSDDNASSDDEVTIRISNWEEYIDLGDWDEEEAIDLDDETVIFGENSLVDDFVDWYYDTYHIKVNVEYSTFGTNEELYNQLNLGDVYDLVCPSDYMIMKLMADKEVKPFSEEFLDPDNEYNYYINGVSPYIYNQFKNNEIAGEVWAKYAACYMWGTTGIVYNPEYVTDEEAATWSILCDEKFKRRITIKDNVRDSLFAAMGVVYKDTLMSEEFRQKEDYAELLQSIMNDTSPETVDKCEKVLKDMAGVTYSFETDSGKADMVTGKVYANYQWSGDAVYTMDQADEDGVELRYIMPEECSNLWFDGWVMLNKGIGNDQKKQHACEAFINFVSRPDNAVRNMYYIGYSSAIAGTEDDTTVEDYINWCYASEDEEEDVDTEAEESGEDEEAEEEYEPWDYDISYFFGREVIIPADTSSMHRQLTAQYPSEEEMSRCAIMWYFDDDASKRINQMWINVRCFDMSKAIVPIIIIAGALLALIIVGLIYSNRHKVFTIKKK